MILSLALIRFYMIGLLELDCEINLIANDKRDSAYLWTSCFSYLFFGHLIDNVRHTKRLFVCLEFFAAVWFIIMGGAFLHDFSKNTKWSANLFPLNFFMVSGLQILQLIQLFNWFPKWWLATVIGIWYLIQQAGYVSRFLIEG